MRVDGPDDPFDHGWIQGLSRPDRRFRVCDRADRLVETPPLVLERTALRPEHLRKRTPIAIQHGLDLLQRKTQEFQRDDLLEPFQLAHTVETVSRPRPFRTQERKAIVVVERADGHAREVREGPHVIDLLVHASNPFPHQDQV